MVRKEEKPFGQYIESSGPQFQDCRFLSLYKTRCRSGQFLLRSYSVGHQRCDCFSAPRRAWPRFFTSSASSLMDCSLRGRPSPRASEALASSMVARNSARFRSRSSHCRKASRTASSLLRNRPLSMGPLNKGFLVGREKHFHAHSVRAPQASVKRRNVGAPTFSRSAAARRRVAIATRPPNDRPTAIPTASL